jgi:nitrate/TMAO reductase-like tetraheme cytochrome c subunit
MGISISKHPIIPSNEVDKIIINIEQYTEDISSIEDKSTKTSKYNALREETNETNGQNNTGEKESANISPNLNNENKSYYKELIEPKMIW